MRPNTLTRCIFKTNITNECRVDNYETIYKIIDEIKEKYFKAMNYKSTKNITIRMRRDQADIPPKSGEICYNVLLETDNSGCV
jgi:hypothetical protein